MSIRAPAERHTDQPALEVVRPLVIAADMDLGVAVNVALHDGALMGATVDESSNPSIFGPVDDHRRVADCHGAEVAWTRNLAFECEVIPHRPAEDTFLLQGIDVCVVIHAERNPAAIGFRKAIASRDQGCVDSVVRHGAASGFIASEASV